ncbi:hypothetical protein PENTCL1PPCAC_6507 [Pristionchus entomophagus]|uniref:Uncharacterized protein n=1 Tax=Pristionchus entomophagus TaxID=358040 RepID=A0AAV5SP91_9BILA|nr:hypothetical protein PENTCL1PPCAC_6507 [Pristionchus entomophagus]
MNREESTSQDNNYDLPVTPSKAGTICALQVRRVPRLISPGAELKFPNPRTVKSNRREWDASDSSMPVLEKMDWIEPQNDKKHLDNVVWKWIRQGPGVAAVGRWMAEDETVEPMLIDYEEGPIHEAPEVRWAMRGAERRRMAMMERRRSRLSMSCPLVDGHISLSLISQEIIDHAECTDEYEEHPDTEILEEEAVDVVDGVEEDVPIPSSFPSNHSNHEWIYDEGGIAPPLPSQIYHEKETHYDPVAIASSLRSRKAAMRMNREKRQNEEEERKRRLKEEREERLEREALEMAEEKRRRETADVTIQSRRAKRADYVRRLRNDKRIEIGEEEWQKHLEKEREKRRAREKRKMQNPGYIEKKRMRQTLKTREIRANQAMLEGRRAYYIERQEEVYEDGVYEMEETEGNHNKEGGHTKQDDEEIEVEKW